MLPRIKSWLVASLTAVSFSSAAHAQFQIDWYTIDSGGGAASGGSFSLNGTIGQPDAASSAGGTFDCAGGFWSVFGTAAAPCYPNCDGSTGSPRLTSNDFQCFINKYAANDPYANCDGSTFTPVLTSNDFQCFLNAFAAGCQ